MAIEAWLKKAILYGVRHLLSEQDATPYSPTFGCFDRRYWGWKLVDYSEATFQRAVYPLAWAYQNLNDVVDANLLQLRIRAGLLYAMKIQHKNGSFDQAFPYEQSFGATAFLLHPLCYAYTAISHTLSEKEKSQIRQMLQRGVEFLVKHDEAHAHITNHLAGAVLSLLICAKEFNCPRYQESAESLLNKILTMQSDEGWFIEYNGADPGYQTLCLYYLAQVQEHIQSPALDKALEKSIDFLKWFIHPDGTFGGEYGSRRTAVYYSGGIAILAKKSKQASALNTFMLDSIQQGTTTVIYDIDMGNLIPLLSNYVLTADHINQKIDSLPLPFEQQCEKDFTQAGLYIRHRGNYYMIIGVSNGGVIKIFDILKAICIYDDGGYVASLANGHQLASQNTDLKRPVHVNQEGIHFTTQFVEMDAFPPTPFQLWVLRLLNLTLMRNITIGNLVKRMLVRLLINKSNTTSLFLHRHIKLKEQTIEIWDTIDNQDALPIVKLQYGIPFSAIHMASANYFDGQMIKHFPFERPLDTLELSMKVYPA